MAEADLRHYSTYVPPSTYGSLKAMAQALKTGGVNGTVRAFLDTFPDGRELGLAVIRGLSAIEQHVDEKWVRVAVTLDEGMKGKVDYAAALSGMQKGFVVGVVLVAMSREVSSRISAARGSAGSRGENGQEEGSD